MRRARPTKRLSPSKLPFIAPEGALTHVPRQPAQPN